MQQDWLEIHSLLSQILPTTAESFNSPASHQQIESLESSISQRLPEPFKEYLKTFNGQRDDNFTNCFIGYNRLLSVNEILQMWKDMVEWFGDEEIDWLNENRVRAVMWDRGWIPFADYGGGSTQLILDLNPGKNGRYGQIFQMWPGRDMEEDTIVIANSFDEFSGIIVRRLKSDDYVLEEGVIQFEDWA